MRSLPHVPQKAAFYEGRVVALATERPHKIECDGTVVPGRPQKLFEVEKFDKLVNLAAQAGVRYSITNPYAYMQSNMVGFLNILEACRNFNVKHLIYASSSSVYGLNSKVPYSEDDKVDSPVSLYAASKKSNERQRVSQSRCSTTAT